MNISYCYTDLRRQTKPLQSVTFQDSHSLGCKKFQDSPGRQEHFPGPYREPATFRYSDKQQQLCGLRSAISSPRSVRGRDPATKAFLAYLQPRKRTWWQQLWLFSSAEACLFGAKNCHSHHCLANSRTFPNSLQVDFQDFPGPGNFPVQIPGLYRRRGNPGNIQNNHINSTSTC